MFKKLVMLSALLLAACQTSNQSGMKDLGQEFYPVTGDAAITQLVSGRTVEYLQKNPRRQHESTNFQH